MSNINELTILEVIENLQARCDGMILSYTLPPSPENGLDFVVTHSGSPRDLFALAKYTNSVMDEYVNSFIYGDWEGEEDD